MVGDAEDGAVVLADKGFKGGGVAGAGALDEGDVRMDFFGAGMFEDGHLSRPVYRWNGTRGSGSLR